MRAIAKHDLLAAMKAGCRFDGYEFATHGGVNPYHGRPPPWHKPFQPPFQRGSDSTAIISQNTDYISPQQFEYRAKQALQKFADVIGPYQMPWPQLDPAVLKEVLAEASAELLQPIGSGISDAERLNMRTGLQIHYVEIGLNASGTPAVFDIVNADLRFSLRLLCCVIHTPLALSNLKLVTLDLSGSALAGVDGSFLQASGSVRLRNSFSSAPIDFGGARIRGYFDGSRLLMHPFGPFPAVQAVDGDRGMLNLGQASIDNEVRLNKAVIWGGLTMRAMRTQRTLFLNDAKLLSPLAVLEQMLLVHVRSPELADISELPVGIFLHVFSSEHSKLETTSLPILLNENMKVRTSALRADGLIVAGSIFARKLRCHGRFRMKYAEVKGALSLQGASLSSPEKQLASFDKAQGQTGIKAAEDLIEYRRCTYKRLVKRDNPERTPHQTENELAPRADEFAFDLRDSRFGGSVRIGTHPEEAKTCPWGATKIDGIVAIERLRADGELVFDGAEFAWTCRIKERNGDECYDTIMTRVNEERDTLVLAAKKFNISARGLEITDTLSFAGCKGLNGIDVDNSIIGGDFIFFRSMKQAQANPLTIELIDSADGLKGRINLEGSSIAGDCRLLFNLKAGPTLKAGRSSIEGTLTIAPNTFCQDIGLSPEGFADLQAFAADDRYRMRAAAAKGRATWRKMEAVQKTFPLIDLANAKAGYLEHPPAAWPRTGRLKISGFEYRLASRLGPLAPHPFSSDRVWPKTAIQRIYFAFALSLTLAWASTFALVWCDQVWLNSSTGVWPTRTLWLISFLGSGLTLFGLIVKPRVGQNQPMAIEWLNLQVFMRNAYRSKHRASASHYSLPFLRRFTWVQNRQQGNIYHSLKPYTVAAQALREEGRWISANLVEARRLRVREKQLSWRLHAVQKLIFRAMSRVNNYGFSLTRPLFIIAGLISLGAMAAHDAGMAGAVKRKDYRVDGIPPDIFQSDEYPQRQARLPTGFVPIIYATGKLLPAIDFGQEADWELLKTAYPRHLDCWPSWLTYPIIFALLQLVAFGIFGLLAIALTTRLGLTFNRYNE